MKNPLVSIVILNYNNPRVITKCLTTLAITEGVSYETVVVDNGSTEDGTIETLHSLKDKGLIDTLVLSQVNTLFSGGNNLGVANTNPNSEYILLLNSDVAFLRSDWLTKMLAWMNGTAVYEPCVWDFAPTNPSPGKKDIISIGWSHDANIEGRVRPEGWCCMFRRSVWRDISTDMQWYYGFEEMVANVVRDGAKCGVLFNYAPYLVHREGGSGKVDPGFIRDTRAPDMSSWYAGLNIESLDFTLGPNEHDSYLKW